MRGCFAQRKCLPAVELPSKIATTVYYYRGGGRVPQGSNTGIESGWALASVGVCSVAGFFSAEQRGDRDSRQRIRHQHSSSHLVLLGRQKSPMLNRNIPTNKGRIPVATTQKFRLCLALLSLVESTAVRFVLVPSGIKDCRAVCLPSARASHFLLARNIPTTTSPASISPPITLPTTTAVVLFAAVTWERCNTANVRQGDAKVLAVKVAYSCAQTTTGSRCRVEEGAVAHAASCTEVRKKYVPTGVNASSPEYLMVDTSQQNLRIVDTINGKGSGVKMARSTW